MAPGNWDGPFFLSYHDENTIYSGTEQLWKSTDGGASWKTLGDFNHQSKPKRADHYGPTRR